MTKIGDEIQELISDMVLPPLEDGDITIKKLAHESGIGERAWRDKMLKMTESGKWKIVWKRNSTGGRVQTFKKVL
jgi:hypothetical protein